jgi:hypothetical protein
VTSIDSVRWSANHDSRNATPKIRITTPTRVSVLPSVNHAHGLRRVGEGDAGASAGSSAIVGVATGAAWAPYVGRGGIAASSTVTTDAGTQARVATGSIAEAATSVTGGASLGTALGEVDARSSASSRRSIAASLAPGSAATPIGTRARRRSTNAPIANPIAPSSTVNRKPSWIRSPSTRPRSSPISLNIDVSLG